MSDVFDDLAKAFKAGHDAGRSEAADEIERLREACKNASSYISVRDQFAMAALTGMLMRSVGYEETAEKAYKFADAMIKAREVK